MPRKRYKPEEIIAKLRQVDVLVSQGQSMVEAIRQIGVSEVTFYRWRQEFGGLKIEQVKRLKELELENSRLRKAVSDLTLDKLILTEAAKGNFQAPRVGAPASSISEDNCMSPSAAPVRRSGSTARRSARCRRPPKSPQMFSLDFEQTGVHGCGTAQPPQQTGKPQHQPPLNGSLSVIVGN